MPLLPTFRTGITLRWTRPDDPVAVALARAQQRELTLSNPPDHVPHGLRDDIVFVVAEAEGTALACGALQALEPGAAEIKRMYVRPEYRRTGMSRLVLAAIEERAVSHGIEVLRLETALAFTAAVALYRSVGYRPIPAYGEYVGDPLSYCMERRLSPRS